MNRRDVLKIAGAAAAAGALAGTDELFAAPGTAPGPRLILRRAGERGHADYGWLDTRHTFSFARYHDPRHMGFRGLRVINEDRVIPGRGFPMHPHRDMEILTYVLEGALEHRDSLGHGSVIVPGEVQRMSAGRGIHHSEFNPTAREGVHFLQIWILPRRKRVRPSYAQRRFDAKSRADRLALVASPTARGGSIGINADANLYAARLGPRKSVVHENPRGRHAWLQVARGELTVNGTALAAGDGVRTSDPGRLEVASARGAELLLFDLA